ncbi:MAG TPA: 50S ribosomal protein L10 [Pseudobdellovibrionaceae bacterium]|nr:50S ribosomal protein L10 [Pseudobdellovibrionaceae bacterium]
MITRTDKEQQIGSIVDKFSKSKAAFIVDFKGMKVEQVTDLRKKLFPIEAEMKVVRNTLAKRALMKYPEMESALSKSFLGTNAIVFAFGDVTATAKTLSNFSKDVEMLQLKTGVMDGKPMDEAKIQFLATLPGKDQLRAQLLAVFLAPATQLVRTLNEVPSSLARVLKAKADTQQ